MKSPTFVAQLHEIHPHLGPQRPHGADVGDRLGGGLRGRGVGQLRAGVHLGRRRGQDGAEAEAWVGATLAEEPRSEGKCRIWTLE